MNEAFFNEAGRGLLIEQVHHHGSFTQDTILLNGPEGVGKSTFAQALMDSLSNDVVVRIDLKTPVDKAGIQQLITQSPDGRFLQQCLSGDTAFDDSYGAWLIIDDAQLLSPDAISDLAHQFAQLEQGALVLCVDQLALSDVVASLGGREHQVFDLKPMTDAQMQQYVAFWFAESGSGQALDSQDIEYVVSQAQGLPGLAAGPLTQFLLKKVASTTPSHTEPDTSPSTVVDAAEQSVATASFQDALSAVASYQSMGQRQSAEKAGSNQAEAIELELLKTKMAETAIDESESIEDALQDDEVVLSSMSTAAPSQTNQPKSASKAKRKQSRRDKNRKRRSAKQNKAPDNAIATEDSQGKAIQKQPTQAAPSIPQASDGSAESPKLIKSKPPTLYPYLLMFLITCVLGWFMLELFYPQVADNSASKASEFSPAQRETLLNLATEPERK